MLKCGADVNLRSNQGETPFYLAIFHHVQHPDQIDATCIRALYYAGSDVNATNAKGYAPIHLAANFGHATLVKWLLTKGASANVQPYPYILAHMQGHQLTASLLRNQHLRAIES
ncbi:hypothetical protein RI129_010729 [Pyrocoelia pectoralis]|uniref:Ankyrin repeat protein n=1 Tax=Pyrocoelia pectoralis TaxID=417401 RepID=A0AAN7V6I3_9COLE